jgi:hypothetical protein
MKRVLPLFIVAPLILAGCAGAAPTQALRGNNPYGIPQTVRLAMPSALGGGGVIAAGGGNYRVHEAGQSLAAGVKGNTDVYTNSTALIDAILQGISKGRPVPGTSYTFDDPGHPAKQLTVLLEVKSDHAVISVGRGKSAKGPSQLIGISYTSPKNGTAVFKPDDVTPELGKFVLATDFDLEKGTASTDALSDTTGTTSADPHRLAGHWEFRSDKADPQGAVFRMQVAAFIAKPGKDSESGVYAASANFLADGSGAFVAGAQNAATGGQFFFMPSDGLSFGKDAPHDLYMTADAQDLPATKASAALKAILPTDDSIYKPFPGDPSQGNPYDAKRFDFPQ